MAQFDETKIDYAVMLSPHDEYWSWAIYDLEGHSRATGQEIDRDSAWRSGLLAAGAIGA